MTKLQKTAIIDNLASEFSAATAIVVAEYKGTTVKELETIRNEARANGMKVKVVKNTLADLAFKKANIEGMQLKDTNIVFWGAEQLDVCKLAAKYAESYDKRLVIKTGSLEGKVATAQTVIAMSKLPSRLELIGMLLSVWTAPARMMVTGLDELRKKKEAA